MKSFNFQSISPFSFYNLSFSFRPLTLLLLTATLSACGNGVKKDDSFFTSGSREADQRAEQRIAKAQQLQGDTQNTNANPLGIPGQPNATPAKKSLYERLGGNDGITRIVDDFISRALADPRVNWERKALSANGVLGLGKKPDPWKATDDAVKTMKLHITQFLAVATGGPSKYEGRNMTEAHQGLKISNPEFDAAVGDLKATLDKFHIPIDDQKELLAIVESTRPQIVEVR